MPWLVHAWWWALDYLYAGTRQLAIFAPPWTRGPRRAPTAWNEGASRLPEIVLLPGVYEHWSFLRPLGDALNAAGHRVRVVHGLRTNRLPVGATAAKLEKALAASPAPPAGRVLVAHSKGGLIGKHLLVTTGAAQDAARAAASGEDPAVAAASATPATARDAASARPLGVLGMVAVCTPFSGSGLAKWVRVPSIQAFRPTDETIVMLGRSTSVNGRIVSVYGRYDPHIPEGSALTGATNVEVAAVGHFRVLGSSLTHRAVIDGVALLTGG
ncbi:hypothetical protein [Microbacterium sp. P02]|uniref:hypothetical protein n=1 Tax=unclassified Microbacterium TaxID=2609290 RepID=UPI00366E37B1